MMNESSAMGLCKMHLIQPQQRQKNKEKIQKKDDHVMD